MSLDKNKALVRRYFENKGDYTIAAEVVTPEHVKDVEQLFIRIHKAFPDFLITIEEQIAEGDLVATRFTASGTHLGEWRSPLGIHPPTGRRFQHEGIRIFRIVDGKLTETWGGADTLSQLIQLGILQPHTTSNEEQ